MGTCSCGYTTDPDKNCNGTHKVVKKVKEDLKISIASNCLWNKPENNSCDCSWHLAAAKVK
jgi:hypothetical protein